MCCQWWWSFLSKINLLKYFSRSIINSFYFETFFLIVELSQFDSASDRSVWLECKETDSSVNWLIIRPLIFAHWTCNHHTNTKELKTFLSLFPFEYKSIYKLIGTIFNLIYKGSIWAKNMTSFFLFLAQTEPRTNFILSSFQDFRKQQCIYLLYFVHFIVVCTFASSLNDVLPSHGIS